MNFYLGLFVFAFSFQIAAHEGHVHEPAVEAPPHGGLLRDAPPFKSELVLSGDKAKIYVYDKKLKSVKLDKDTLTGELILPKNKDKKVVTLGKWSEGISRLWRGQYSVKAEKLQ
jgi:hypothetical protein